MRRAARTALVPAVLTALAVAFQFVPPAVLARDPAPGWLPTLGSRAVTSAVYREMLFAVGTLVVLASACALGYREARHREVGRTYLRYVGVVYAAGTTVMLLIFAGSVVTGGPAGSNPFTVPLTVASLLVAVPGVLTVAALAGVALASTRGADAPASSPRELIPFALGTGAVAGAGYVLDSLADLAMASGGGVGVPASLPQFGTIGTTVVTYVHVSRLAGDLALIGGGIALGTLAARRTGVAAPSRRFVVSAAAGALGGLLTAWVPVTWYVTVGAPDPAPQPFASVAVSLPSAVVSAAAVAVLAVVAGVGVARFEADEGDAGESRAADGPGSDAVTEPP